MNEQIKFGAIATLLPAPDLVKVGIAAEKYGFDSVWVPDHYVDLPPSGDRHDPWVILSAIAAQTRKIILSTAATDVLRYHPSKLAHIIVTLDEVSTGRAMVGLGSGEAMNIVPFGIEWEKPADRIQRLRETIEVMRLLWRSSKERRVDYMGRFYRLEKAWLDTPPYQNNRPKIFVAALASKLLLTVTGEIGDGWLSGYNTIESFKERVKIVQDAAKASHRNPDSIRIAQWFSAALSENEDQLKKARRAVAPEIVLCADRNTLNRFGFEISSEIHKDSNIIYTQSLADPEIASLASSTSEKMSEEMIEEFVPCGKPAEIIEAIDRYRKNGATDIILRDVVGQIVEKSADSAIETLKNFSEKVMPYFREN